MAGQQYKTVVMDDSTWAVVRTDAQKPRFMELIATFYDEARAKHYTNLLNGPSEEPDEHAAAPEAAAARHEQGMRPAGSESDLSQRQSAVLRALREKMDENNQVAMRAAALAEAAKIPLGSLHSVLGSLEKRNLIQTARPGSARSPAVYRVLSTG